MRGTLTQWVRAHDGGFKTAPDGTRVPSTVLHPLAGCPPTPGAVETREEELARLRARVAELEIDEAKLATERDILRKAAKYFAGETRW